MANNSPRNSAGTSSAVQKKAILPLKATLKVEVRGFPTFSKAPTKTARVLKHLVFKGTRNRFEAERLGAHCLHSTICKLSNYYGLKFIRESERVPNNWGTPCRVIRYSLPGSERKRARALRKLLCSAAGAKGQAA